MITLSDIQQVGKFLKPHGVNGEITLLRTMDDLELEDHSCLIVDIDGIYVPFFPTSVRPKGADTDLVMIDGIDNEQMASELTNKAAYVLKAELPTEDTDEGIMFADDFIGYEVILDSGEVLGKICRIEDSTANYLFIVETPAGNNLLIPVADEFVIGVDSDKKELTLSLPEGLLDMQN